MTGKQKADNDDEKQRNGEDGKQSKSQGGKERNSEADPARLTETDLANERMGNNQLQADDQEEVRNQRHAVPGVTKKTEGVVESFENMDPETRARRSRDDQET